jgi:hypothetical protein
VLGTLSESTFDAGQAQSIDYVVRKSEGYFLRDTQAPSLMISLRSLTLTRVAIALPTHILKHYAKIDMNQFSRRLIDQDV